MGEFTAAEELDAVLALERSNNSIRATLDGIKVRAMDGSDTDSSLESIEAWLDSMTMHVRALRNVKRAIAALDALAVPSAADGEA